MLVPPALAVGHPAKTWYPPLFAGDGAANCWQSRLPSMKIIWLNVGTSFSERWGHPAKCWYRNLPLLGIIRPMFGIRISLCWEPPGRFVVLQSEQMLAPPSHLAGQMSPSLGIIRPNYGVSAPPRGDQLAKYCKLLVHSSSLTRDHPACFW